MMMPFNREERPLSITETREKEEGLRTVECLRGRLLAERQTSRFAREQAQLMANKLVELENQLREENKLRVKTEKKLKFMKKKLETLLISPALHEPEQSSVCETGIVSSDSSSTVTIASEPKITEEAEVESKFRFEKKGPSPHLELNASERTLAEISVTPTPGVFPMRNRAPLTTNSR